MSKGYAREAFLTSLPVLGGYSVLGFAFGLLVIEGGFPWYVSTIMSVILFAGSAQFVLIGLLASATPLSSIALTMLLVNSRHMFYGISFVDFFKHMGKKRFYMIYSLTDETYALLSLIRSQKRAEEEKHAIAWMVSAMNHSYWVCGSTVGALTGAFVPMVTDGVEFSMTALFTVILVEQLLQQKSYFLALISFVVAFLMHLSFPASAFLFPSMILMLLLLIAQYYMNREERI